MPISQIVTNSIANGAVGATQTATTNQFYGFKNRIINGDMTISQRNGTSSVTPNSSAYTLDRWELSIGVSSKLSVQQSTTAPTGFRNSVLLTSTSAYTPSAGDYISYCQKVEGFNFADMMWGTANAATVTLSFWVRSSLTGTFSGALQNDGAGRSYPFTFTISAANTFEYKTVTIPGDTSGTWNTTNGKGVEVHFNMGSGSNLLGTAGAWVSAWRTGVTGSVSLVGTSGATFFLTGVQLEKGTVATSFDYLPYTTELALCQRYFCKSFPQTVVPANNVAVDQAINGIGGRIQVADVLGFRGQQYFFPVTMRTTPSITMFNPLGASGTGSYFTENASTQNPASPGPYVTSEYNFGVWQYTGVTVGSTGTLVMVIFHYTASAEL